jgi:tRNA dimethylallyltransferase
MMLESSKPIVVIVGPTASGKSDMAMKIAQNHNGEIVCADSRTIYKGMDTGTAKPSQKDRTIVPHHGLDLIDPSERFSAAEFQQYALDKIAEIHEHGRLPVVVGGSGMYIDGLLYNFDFSADSKQDDLEEKDLTELQVLAAKLKSLPSLQVLKNKRHLIGFIRRGGTAGSKERLPSNVIILGLRVPKAVLDLRIEQRVDSMVNDGLVEEVKDLLENWGADAPGMLAPAYKAFSYYLKGELTLEQAKNEFVKQDKQLAKRQVTWFKRNKDIHWVHDLQQAEQLIADFLKKFATIDA